MTQKAQYGMTGAQAGAVQPVIAPPEEQTVELDDENALSERSHKPKPTPASGSRGGAEALPSFYQNPPPPYPDEARRNKEEGLVVLRTQVDTQGLVSSVTVEQSSGFADLNQSALDTVKNWRFKPAQIAGIPIATSVDIPIRFRLTDAH
jgi:protein TonB